MKKTEIGDGIFLFKTTRKEKIKMLAVLVSVILMSFIGVCVVLGAIQPAQMRYDNVSLKYQEKMQSLTEARIEFLDAKKDLAKEKLELATKEENWDEVERLSTVIREINLEKGIEGTWFFRSGQQDFQFPLN